MCPLLHLCKRAKSLLALTEAIIVWLLGITQAYLGYESITTCKTNYRYQIFTINNAGNDVDDSFYFEHIKQTNQ